MPNWHIDLLVEYLEAVTNGELRHLLINVPPRSMKSLLVSVLWPVWEWISRPSERWICTSHAESLSIKHSLDRRAILQSPWFQERWGHIVQLAPDQNAKGEFLNTKRGVMIATSVGGSITGKGGCRIIVDDLHNPTQVESDAQRETALNYFRKTLATRLDDNKRGAIVVIMQRLHESDLSALCMELGYTHLCLPAEAESRTELVFPRSGRVHVREAGDLLWPARDGRDELDMQKRVLGSDAFVAQYQQRPVPAGGSVFQREWLRYYDELPPLDFWAESWDMSFKDRKDSDYVVGLVAGRRGADIYIVDRSKGQWSFTETCRQLRASLVRYPKVMAVWIEDAANGPAIIDSLKHEIPRIVAVQPDGGKMARACAVQPMVEGGNVYLPNPRPRGVCLPERAWVDDFVAQLLSFPRGRNDDDVDAFTQLLARLRHEVPVRLTWGRRLC